MIDPKVVELSVYNGIPHLLIPVVTDPKKASGALNWAVAEMTGRYQKFAEYNVRDLKGYNKKMWMPIKRHSGSDKPEKMPQIVIIVDELADLMMVAPGEVEDAICRLAQLARAAGIHLIIATQRPSVNVITGLIKANMPSRIAFSVSSGVDSRTIIDMVRSGEASRKGRYAVLSTGLSEACPCAGCFCLRYGSQLMWWSSSPGKWCLPGKCRYREQDQPGPEGKLPADSSGESEIDEYFERQADSSSRRTRLRSVCCSVF